uniref:Glycosyltransferase RgtA/B/C/D-like domain-containing protein n=1 Tax=Solibacter usitatus (strain Ellin6076) TaxID=234267 RepID=Q01NG2_SOLUE
MTVYTGDLDKSPIRLRWQMALLAALVLLAYLPSLRIPLIADDYPNISQSLTYGAPSGLSTLLHDSQFRLRSTSYWVWYGVWQAAGLNAAACHAVSIGLHVIDTWLLLAVALAWPGMRRAAFWAAAFFAVHEGHQEAVMWYSAISELLMFGFGAAALWCWIKGRMAATVGLFALALLSKESAVILLPLFALTIERKDWKRGLARLTPLAVMTAAAVLSLTQRGSDFFRLKDGSFSLHAPFWLTWPHSIARLLWIWGWLALAVIVLVGEPRVRRAAAQALAWIGIAFIPYSFLTYSTAVPSRQTYLASAGLALLVGLAISRYAWRREVAVGLLALVVIQNTVILWTKKRAQFVERAAPTSELIEVARSTPGAIWVRCFPLPPVDAEEAVRLGAGRRPADLVWDEQAARVRGAAAFCYREIR